jgi:RNA polymerase sigma-70 factor, ECF subfamily
LGNEAELAKELESHRDYLMRFALFMLRDSALAEDAVQETFISALASHGDFQGRSQLRTWLTAILKNKVFDLARSRSKGPPMVSSDDFREDGGRDGAFGDKGQWIDPPSNWGLPDEALESSQFWETYLKCCKVMPERHALVFSMREVLDLSADEICKKLGLTTSNLHVILFRARQSLRACMTKNWFGVGHA